MHVCLMCSVCMKSWPHIASPTNTFVVRWCMTMLHDHVTFSSCIITPDYQVYIEYGSDHFILVFFVLLQFVRFFAAFRIARVYFVKLFVLFCFLKLVSVLPLASCGLAKHLLCYNNCINCSICYEHLCTILVKLCGPQHEHGWATLIWSRLGVAGFVRGNKTILVFVGVRWCLLVRVYWYPSLLVS